MPGSIDDSSEISMLLMKPCRYGCEAESAIRKFASDQAPFSLWKAPMHTAIAGTSKKIVV